jgi:hypothetical protein
VDEKGRRDAAEGEEANAASARLEKVASRGGQSLWIGAHGQQSW